MALEKNNVELIHKTRPYASEVLGVSVWVVISSFALLIVSVAVSIVANSIFLKLVFSIFISLLVTRCFILFHDYHHKAILSGSGWAKLLFELFGLSVFVPSSIWRQSHNFHHAHNAVLETSHIGSFWTVSVSQWLRMDWFERYKYKVVRKPVMIVLGVFTVFIYDHCINSFIRNSLKNIVGLLTLLIHVSAVLLAVHYGFFFDYFWAWLLPIALAGCFGSYLFYAQHNFPDVVLLDRKKWSYSNAALVSTCFIEMPKIMHWFTGNIAYHHVHHLNHRIPFYRLPEAMAEIEELHSPLKTSLRWRDIVACLKLKLWDESENKMIRFSDLKAEPGQIVRS